MPEKNVLLKASSLSFAYEERKVLNNISFKLLEQERLGILGSSGSGKTTLLRLIEGKEWPDEGELLLAGRSYDGVRNDLLKYHPEVSLMAQDFNLDINLSADDNIYRAGRHLSESALKRYLGKVHRGFNMQRFKDQKVRILSGGQKQRLALACALIAPARLLLLDEPFSQLDYQLKQEILSFLESQEMKRGIIMVGHEPSDLMRFCDRLLVMDKGRVLQYGSVEEIYHKPKSRRVGELSGIINALSAKEREICGLDAALFRPSHCRLHAEGQGWILKSMAYHPYGRLGRFEHRSGKLVIAQIPLEGEYRRGSSWGLSIKM